MAKRRMSLVAVAATAMMALPGGSVAQAEPAMDCHLFPPPVNPVLCYVRDNIGCQVHWVAEIIEEYPPLPPNDCITPD